MLKRWADLNTEGGTSLAGQQGTRALIQWTVRSSSGVGYSCGRQSSQHNVPQLASDGCGCVCLTSKGRKGRRARQRDTLQGSSNLGDIFTAAKFHLDGYRGSEIRAHKL